MNYPGFLRSNVFSAGLITTITIYVISFPCENSLLAHIKTETTKTTAEITADVQVKIIQNCQVIVIRCPL